jgi:hypothetical protein
MGIQKVDHAEFVMLWRNPNLSGAEISEMLGVSRTYASTLAGRLGLQRHKTGRKPDPVVVDKPAADPVVTSEILRTKGKYRALCAYADAHGISYNKALALWHRERMA